MEHLSSVLLVDDDATANFINDLLLKKLGVTERVMIAENGAQALELLAQLEEPPSLLLLDMNMPTLNGIEFLDAYKQLPGARQTRTVVIILTISPPERALPRLQGLAADGVVTKPLTEDKLTEILQVHFNWQLPA